MMTGRTSDNDRIIFSGMVNLVSVRDFPARTTSTAFVRIGILNICIRRGEKGTDQ